MPTNANLGAKPARADQEETWARSRIELVLMSMIHERQRELAPLLEQMDVWRKR